MNLEIRVRDDRQTIEIVRDGVSSILVGKTIKNVCEEVAMQLRLEGVPLDDVETTVKTWIELKLVKDDRCPGWPNCHCDRNSKWSTKEDPHGAFGAPGSMGG